MVRLVTGNPDEPLDEERSRSGSTAGGVLLQDIEDEYKREFALEFHRRTDQLRFGNYTTPSPWALTQNDKAYPFNTAEYTKLFPIPYAELAKNSNLVQNPGYGN